MTPSEQLALTQDLRQRLKTRQQEINQHYQQEQAAHLPESPGEIGAIHETLSARAALVDSVLCELWRAMAFPEGWSLVAVGGYGRRELYPASDVDLLILLPKQVPAELEARLEQLVGLFWDIGLEIGHSVRTVEECLEEASGDITIQTTLLESRLLTGSSALYDDFCRRLRLDLDPLLFYQAKRLEQAERYQRFQETPYSLEPNCKESPGGLRDLQVILWVAQAAGFGNSWADLATGNFITQSELAQLETCERQLQRIRLNLHLTVRRREDRLLFDFQRPLADVLGYTADAGKRASENFMQEYYKNAKRVTQLNTVIMQNFGVALFPSIVQPLEPINPRFQVAHELLDVTSEDIFEQRPSAILESFLLMQQHPELQGMTARTLRALWRARELITPEFRAEPENRRLFLSLLQSERGIVHEFRRMNQYSILGAYLPAFAKIVGQMQHDLFHVYTVDQHILMVMRNLRRFTMSEFAHEFPMCSRLVAEFDRPWVLYVAALFHDIAKGRGGDHSTLGMVDTREFCEQHEMQPEDTELVVWLVGAHLLMSQVAQKEDLSDPDVITRFASKIPDERHLTALYLLTVADIRGTSHKVWNQWKAKLLADLYYMTLHRITTGDSDSAPHGVIQERRAEAMRLLRYFALSDGVQERLWKQLDTVYFLRHSAEEIAWHTRSLYYRIANDQPVVKARPHGEGSLQVMVYTRDEPDLFVRLVGFFARAGYSIVDAKIHTTKHGYALDSFILLDTDNTNDPKVMTAYIEYELTQRLTHHAPIDEPGTGRLSRHAKHFPMTPAITIRADEKGTQYLLSIAATDRPGLLYIIARTLARHRVSLLTAKIATLGERVEDVFLVTGGQLEQSTERIRLETELLEQLKI